MEFTNVDPVQQTERELSEGVLAIHRDVLGQSGATVHVHLEDDAVVCVTENFELTRLEFGPREQVIAAISQLTKRILGRELVGDAESSWPRPGLVVTVMRLAPAVEPPGRR